MILPDVNVLIYAYRTDSPHHGVCKPWLEQATRGETNFALSRLALSAVVRILTNRRAFPRPDPPEDAFHYCNSLLARRNCVVVEPGERHWQIFQRLCIETNVQGPMVTDAYFAALAIEWGCEWITLDRDYARFPGLKWSVPATP
jgi:toxin-antitoxin system PIN domain toxin